MINPIGYSTNYYPAIGTNSIGQSVNPINKINGVTPVNEKNSISTGKVKPSECQTCKNRTYVDQSNENVSFKSPTHISPGASYAAVSSHEQEHVSNAISKGSQGNNQLVSTSVALKTAICPECGTSYVAGGTTTSQIKYSESNPYEASRKSAESSMLKGLYVNYVA